MIRRFIAAMLAGAALAVALVLVVVTSRPPAAAAHVTATPAPEQESPLIYECAGQPCQNAQEFEVFDNNGAPIFSVGEFGDVGTFGTGFAVFAPGSVTNPVVTLNTNGTVTAGGQTLTPADIAMLHQLRPGELTFLSRLWRACQQQACLTAKAGA